MVAIPDAVCGITFGQIKEVVKNQQKKCLNKKEK